MRITNFLNQLLISEKDYAKLLDNGTKSAISSHDPKPVIKLFTPDWAATWLLTELDPNDKDRAFGLCDLWLGFPELWWVSISELTSLRGAMGLPIERDRHIIFDKSLSYYTEKAETENWIR